MPGYGYAVVARKDKARFNQSVSDYLVNRPNLACLFALIDASLPPQKIDLEFMEFLVDHEVPFVLVFTKMDKAGAVHTEKNIADFMARVAEWTANPPLAITCSAVERKGRNALLKVIDDALEPEQKNPHPVKAPPKRNTPW